MQNRLNRLKEERKALDENIDKLITFLHKIEEFDYNIGNATTFLNNSDGPNISAVSQREIMILEKQHKTMSKYSDLLAIRITYTNDMLDNMKCTYEVLPNGDYKKLCI